MGCIIVILGKIRALCTPPRFLFTYTLGTISNDFYLTLQGIIIDILVQIPDSCVVGLPTSKREEAY